jgi:hypothetical protein
MRSSARVPSCNLDDRGGDTHAPTATLADVTEDGTHLQLHLVGGPADQHRVSLTDLTTIASGVQNAVRNVGAVLAGQSTGHGGRKLGWIEQATELVLVAPPKAGSVALELELAGDVPTLEVEDQDLGPQALAAFVNVLDALAPDQPLPRGFDPGVLKAINTMAPVFKKGYTSIGLAIGRNGDERRVAVTTERIAVAKRLRERPLSAVTSVEGVLIAVDLAGDPLSCRIDRPFLPSVACYIPREMREVVKSLIERQVRVDGVGEFEPGSDEPRRIHVEGLHGDPAGGIDRTAWRQHRPWQELALQQGTEPARAEAFPDLFDDDEDFKLFLAATHGQTGT